MTTVAGATPTAVRRPTAVRGRLRRLIAGAAVVDLAGAVLCLAATSTVAGWLSVGDEPVLGIGASFLLAALVGAETAIRPSVGVRWIVGANLVYAAWCLLVAATDGPDAWGAVLLVGAASSAAATAAAEWRLSLGR